MQVVMYIMARPNQKSLRERISSDLENWDHGDGLYVKFQQRKGRPQGWAKVKQHGSPGALNIKWDADAKTLVARAVTKGGNKPDDLIGAFVAYLLRVHGRRIDTVTMRTIN